MSANDVTQDEMYMGATLGHEEPLPDAVRKPEHAPRAWGIASIRAAKSGDYYQLTVDGGRGVTVTVKHNHKHDRMACFTCGTADRCAHVDVVRRHLEHTS